MHRFQKNLNFLLESSCLAQSTIAKKAGVNKSTLHNYSTGTIPVSIQTIESLARFFKVHPGDLAYGDLKGGEGFESLKAGEPLEFKVTVERVKS